jgi:hypothetical protein
MITAVRAFQKKLELFIEHLHQCLRVALTPFVPKFNSLAGAKKCQNIYFIDARAKPRVTYTLILYGPQ